MSEFTIGEMAALNCVSERALRFYQKKGLLQPDHVDESNGYRYYSVDQSSTIDMIIEFEELGFSIDEIKAILETRSIDSLEVALRRRVGALDEEIAQREVARLNAERLLESCRTIRESPLFDTVMVENIPERKLVNFDILNEESALLSNDGAAYLREWEMNLRLTKQEMLSRGLPRSFFRSVGCRISGEDLRRRNFRLSGSFVIVGGKGEPDDCEMETIPAGRYLTLYNARYVAADGGNAELAGIEKLLDYAERHYFEIAGDYLGEIIAETPAFQYEGRDMLFKQQIPVSVVQADRAGT